MNDSNMYRLHDFLDDIKSELTHYYKKHYICHSVEGIEVATSQEELRESMSYHLGEIKLDINLFIETSEWGDFVLDYDGIFANEPEDIIDGETLLMIIQDCGYKYGYLFDLEQSEIEYGNSDIHVTNGDPEQFETEGSAAVKLHLIIMDNDEEYLRCRSFYLLGLLNIINASNNLDDIEYSARLLNKELSYNHFIEYDEEIYKEGNHYVGDDFFSAKKMMFNAKYYDITWYKKDDLTKSIIDRTNSKNYLDILRKIAINDGWIKSVNRYLKDHPTQHEVIK